MGQLYLVRHGQANSNATTEAEYDRLSELGHRQAALLGEWLRTHEAPFDRVISGNMRRHRETAEGMGYPPESQDARLNELSYFALVRDMQVNHGLKPPVSSEDFAIHMPQTLAAWENKTVDGDEPFTTFEARILAALTEAAEPGKRVLCMTSGGVIAMIMRTTLGLCADQMARVMLPIYNTSLHKFYIRPDGMALMSFNAIPHLDPPNLADHRTHY